MCPGLWRPQVFFAPWANCVYYHTLFFFFFWCRHQSAAATTSRTPIKTIIPRCEKLSPPHVSLLSLRLVPLTGPFCPGRWNMRHLPLLARLAAGLMGQVLGEGDGNWQGLYIILLGKNRVEMGGVQWPLINTIFTHWAEKGRADSISETLPFSSLMLQ